MEPVIAAHLWQTPYTQAKEIDKKIMDQQHPRKVFEQAVALLKAGRRDDAETLCRNTLERDPGDINFVALLGSILADKGDLDEAETLLTRAVKAAPGHAKAQEDVGTVLLNRNRAEEAIPYLKRASELRPQHPPLLSKLSGAYLSLGMKTEAEALRSQATALSPEQAKLEEATRLFVSGKFRESEKLAQELVRANPRDVNSALLLARLAINASCFEDAKAILEKIIEMTPRFIAAWHDLGTVLKELHEYEEAVDVLRKALEIEPSNAMSHYYLGAALAMAAQPEEAVTSYQEAVAIDPQLTGAHIGLGHVLKTVGDQAGGIAAYRSAIELRPNFGETYYSLANLKTFSFDADDIEDMSVRLANEKLPIDCRVHFAFSLGKAYEDLKDYDRAFEHYELANQLHRDTIAYDPVQTEIAHERMRAIFSADFFNKLNASSACLRPDPIFIVGLPRSGSTLLEQILASHSMVDGTSELPDISMIAQDLTQPRSGQVFPQCMNDLSSPEIKGLGEKYLQQTQRHRQTAPFFTDKMPNNFAYVGFIKSILPNAKIIDARRHPMDSCFGCFKQHFAKGQTFTYDLFELGEFYLEYLQMMDHWDTALPGQVLRVQYEDVVADLDTQVRRILEFCELPFEDACVNFHETKRAVRTASSEQVRQPIYKGSVETWRRYGAHLDPLKDILAPVFPKSETSQA
jgi:tetratricopeptide (TPR) repeat protein